MYGIFTNMCPKNHPNVGKYTIHGAYGYHAWVPHGIMGKIIFGHGFPIFARAHLDVWLGIAPPCWIVFQVGYSHNQQTTCEPILFLFVLNDPWSYASFFFFCAIHIYFFLHSTWNWIISHKVGQFTIFKNTIKWNWVIILYRVIEVSLLEHPFRLMIFPANLCSGISQHVWGHRKVIPLNPLEGSMKSP